MPALNFIPAFSKSSFPTHSKTFLSPLFFRTTNDLSKNFVGNLSKNNQRTMFHDEFEEESANIFASPVKKDASLRVCIESIDKRNTPSPPGLGSFNNKVLCNYSRSPRIVGWWNGSGDFLRIPKPLGHGSVNAIEIKNCKKKWKKNDGRRRPPSHLTHQNQMTGIWVTDLAVGPSWKAQKKTSILRRRRGNWASFFS